jgi:hypothetical protein
MRRALATVCLLLVCGCDEATGPLAEKPSKVLERAAGISDAVSDPEVVDLLLDATEGSPGDVHNLSAQLDAILPVLSRRSGVCRLWLLQDSVESTVIVSTVSFPRPQSTNTHVQERERVAAVAAAREQLLRAVQAGGETPRRSPLFAALTRIGMTSSPFRTRTILLISDLREEGIASWECGPIDVDGVTKSLDRERLLLPNSLRGISIVAAFFDIAPAPKCHDTVARHLQLRDAWQQLATRSGARITFTTGPYGGEE